MAKKKVNRRRPAKKGSRARKTPKKKGQKKGVVIREAGFFGWLFFAPYHLAARLTKNWPLIFRAPSRWFAFSISLGFFAFLAVAIFYGVRAKNYDLAEVRRMPERTSVLDRTGKEIARLHGQNRKIIPLSEISGHFEDALIAREDNNFRRHFGVDPRGIARSIFQNIKRREFAQGSSTITMQLARNTFNLQSQKLIDWKAPNKLVELDRKFLEIAVTFRIESHYSKDDILEAYCNRIFLGHSYNGIETASRNYFGKKASELTLSESALLAGIIRGPNLFTPHRNPDAAKSERDTTLDAMVRENFITKEQAEAAKREPLRLRERNNIKTGWSLEFIREELAYILREKNIREGGLTITTTLDSTLQSIAEEALENQLQQVEAKGGYQHISRAQWQRSGSQGRAPYLQGAVVVLDSSTGGVRTLIGGRDVSESQFDRSRRSKRSAGSLFKPFVYLAAYQKGLLPESWVADTPLRAGEVEGASAGWPANADNRYSERIRSGDALVLSRNPSTVRVGNYAGMDAVVDCARAAGLLKESPSDPTLYLGNTPASPWELATAYTTFPNNGVRVVPYLIEKIQGPNGKTLYEASVVKATVAPFEPTGVINNLLREVTNSGTARSLRSRHGFAGPAGGKTGTTNAYHDAWYAGYTSSLTSCVWVGFDSPQTIVDGGYGGALALPIWANIYKRAASLRNIDGTPRYPSNSLDPGLEYVTAQLCRYSGKRATDGCRAAGTAYNDIVPKGMAPPANDFCTIHPLRALPTQ